jgi:hypothetical protein
MGRMMDREEIEEIKTELGNAELCIDDKPTGLIIDQFGRIWERTTAGDLVPARTIMDQ